MDGFGNAYFTEKVYTKSKVLVSFFEKNFIKSWKG